MLRSPFTALRAFLVSAGYHIALCAALGVGILSGCAPAQLPYHGFADQTSLDAKDTYVLRESVGGALDPSHFAQQDQRYTHHGIAYNEQEEGYYQWGRKMYDLGYRDPYYVRDLAPRAMHHSLIDTYDHAIATGFEDAEAEHKH